MLALSISLALILTYHACLWLIGRRTPLFTIQKYNESLRNLWVAQLQSQENGILGVQTIRNASFGATFFANAAILLMMGTLTLTTQTTTIRIFSQSLPPAIAHASLISSKMLILLILFFIAFVCFAQAIRFFSHISFMLGLPASTCPERNITTHLNHGWAYHTRGMKAYFYAIPLAFGLFSDVLMVVVTLGLVIFMYRLDRAPHKPLHTQA